MHCLLVTALVITIKINVNVDINKAICNYDQLRSGRYYFSGLHNEVHCVHLRTEKVGRGGFILSSETFNTDHC